MIKKNSNKGAFLVFLLVGGIANMLVLPGIIYQQDNFLACFFSLFLLTSLWFAIGVFYKEMSLEKEKQSTWFIPENERNHKLIDIKEFEESWVKKQNQKNVKFL